MNIINNLSNSTITPNSSESTKLEKGQKRTTLSKKIKELEIDGKKVHVDSENFSNYTIHKKSKEKKEKDYIEIVVKDFISKKPKKLKISYSGITNEQFAKIDTWKNSMGKVFYLVDVTNKEAFKNNLKFNRNVNELKFDFHDLDNSNLVNQTLQNFNISDNNSELKNRLLEKLEHYF